MQRWEYKVVSMRDGTYTQTLNDLGREGWELITVAADVHETPGASPRGGSLPVPRALGKLEDAATRLSNLDAGEDVVPEAGSTVTTLLWVLRRPLDED